MALNKSTVAAFAAAANLDPLDIEKAYARREDLFKARVDSKDGYTMIGLLSAFAGVFIGGTVCVGSIPLGIAIIAVGGLGMGYGIHGAKGVNKKVTADVEKFLLPPPPALPALPPPTRA